jgi:hypothetical protein
VYVAAHMRRRIMAIQLAPHYIALHYSVKKAKQ